MGWDKWSLEGGDTFYIDVYTFIALLGSRAAKGLEPQIFFGGGSRNVELKVLTRHLNGWNNILENVEAVDV